MTEYEKRMEGRKQRIIGTVCEQIKALHEKAPEAHDEIVALSKSVSNIINWYMLGNLHHKGVTGENMFEKYLEEN